METQKTPNSPSNLEKENRARTIRLPDFRLYYKATIIKTGQYWHKNRNTGSMEQDRTPRNKPMHQKNQLIYDKGGKTIQMWKDSLFNKRCQENWTATCKRIKLKHSLTAYTKISSKWIKDLNVRASTIKILQENIGRTLSGIIHRDTFLDPSPRIMEIKIKQTNIPT